MEGHFSTGQSPQWAVVLMEEEDAEEEKKRRRSERPRKRWEEEVERDLQVLGGRK